MEEQSYYEISKSKFYGYKFNIETEKEVKIIIDQLKLEHKKARHICYAYIVDDNGAKEKVSDDGEPKGTAGMPILNVLKHKGLRNVMLVVVRYFGGIKLGAGGLVRAYTKTASLIFK